MKTASDGAFIAHALASREEVRLSGEYFASAEVHGELECMLAKAEIESRSLHVTLTIEQIAEQVLSLPSDARALLADRLVESLDPLEDEAIRAVWVVEARRRLEEVRSGAVKTIPGEEALAQVRRNLLR
jgi:hypothetical protein